ncbi:hypothetical protein, partial [Klebsiella quasipneumoniae]|uniref:hypothetical protein n=1 Tax=Klebsiella quasipneumoniae TaxID=1463165 RepID=UPI00272FAA1E
MFTAFGSGAIEYRVQKADTKLIITNPDQWSKLADVKGLPTTMLVAEAGHPLEGEADFLVQSTLDQ